MDRPQLTGLNREQLIYIEYLERRLDPLNNNGAVKFMCALNKQLELLAEQIETADIDFTKSDDKLYERFLNTAKLGKDLTSDFKSFILEYGDVIKEDNNKRIPLIEKRAAGRLSTAE